MTINDKLDLLLSIFKNNPNKCSITYDNVKFLLKNELSETELSSMLDKLVEDENVDFNHNFGYKEKLKGTLFLENGGYVQQEIERKLDIDSKRACVDALDVSKKALTFSKKGYFFIKISICLTIFSILVAISIFLIQMYITNTKNNNINKDTNNRKENTNITINPKSSMPTQSLGNKSIIVKIKSDSIK